MATKQFPTLTGIVASDDSAATPNSVGMRDANGDFIARYMTMGRQLLTGGLLATGLRTLTSGDTATANDLVLVGNGASFEIALPAVATVTGMFLFVMNIHASGVVSLNPNASETINGSATTITLATQYAKALLYSTGSEWLRFI